MLEKWKVVTDPRMKKFSVPQEERFPLYSSAITSLHQSSYVTGENLQVYHVMTWIILLSFLLRNISK